MFVSLEALDSQAEIGSVIMHDQVITARFLPNRPNVDLAIILHSIALNDLYAAR